LEDIINKLIFVLLIIAIALSAYANARKKGIWSWPLFVKTVLGILGISAMAGVLIMWLRRLLGPEHALLITLLALVFIAIGIIILARWVNRQSKHRPNRSRRP